MAKSALTVDIKFGRASKGYSSDNNLAAASFARQLRAVVLLRETAIVTGDIPSLQQKIVENVEDDLAKFANQVVKYFMAIKFSRVGSPRLINIDALDESGEAGNMVDRVVRPGTDAGGLLLWPGLAPSTIVRKLHLPAHRRPKNSALTGRNSTYYFDWTGTLNNEIKAALGDLLVRVIQPSITFTTSAASQPARGERGNKLGSVRVRVFKKQGDASTFKGALTSGNWADADKDDTLIRNYMPQAVAEKLNNRDKSKRPWVGPSVAFWIINRLPDVVLNSIRETIK